MKKIIKITESQYSELKTHLINDVVNEKEKINEGTFQPKQQKTFGLDDGKYSKGIADYSDLEFCEMIIGSIKSLYGDSEDAQFDRYNLPSWLSDMGMTTPKYKEMLVGNGLITLCDDGEGNYQHKVVKKGIMKNLLNLKKSFLELSKPVEENPVEDIELNEYDYKDINSETNNVESEDIDYSDDGIDQIIDQSGQYVLAKLTDGQIVYFDGMDSDNPHEVFGDLTLTNDVDEFFNNYETAISVSPENVSAIIEALISSGYSETDVEVQVLKNNIQISEMTTTGSVGGQYETPSCWSSNPIKGKFADKPSMGGEFVKEKKPSQLP